MEKNSEIQSFLNTNSVGMTRKYVLEDVLLYISRRAYCLTN